MADALVIVDIQNDFMPGGALGVEGGDEVIPIINDLQERFELVVATLDWHPPGHSSFALWPDHCVQNTHGAELAPGLHTERIAQTFFKGVDPDIDSYGAFYDNDWRRSTGLEEFLKERDVDHITLVGLTTDYCIKYSALDALKLGFSVTVVLSACRPVHDDKEAIEEMRSSGVEVVPAL